MRDAVGKDSGSQLGGIPEVEGGARLEDVIDHRYTKHQQWNKIFRHTSIIFGNLGEILSLCRLMKRPIWATQWKARASGMVRESRHLMAVPEARESERGVFRINSDSQSSCRNRGGFDLRVLEFSIDEDGAAVNEKIDEDAGEDIDK
jgi:hypothetical protein